MSEIENESILEFIKATAREAGKIVMAEREKAAYSIDFKGHRDLVTSADLAAEKCILSAIQARFPTHQILSEEAAPNLEDAEKLRSPIWIIDPIDGTTNFAHNHHQVGISIAFADKGQVQAGVVYSPFQSELFSARLGGGAYLNEEKIIPRKVDELRGALIGVGRPFKLEDTDEFVEQVRRALLTCRDVRRIGAGSLDICWVACGRLDAFVETLRPWDIAAACLIAREAGAKIGRTKKIDSGIYPDEFDGRNLLVAAPGIFQATLQLMK